MRRKPRPLNGSSRTRHCRESHQRLAPDPYRPVFEPIRLSRPVHRELPATFLAFTGDLTMPPGFWHPGMSGRLNGADVIEIDGDHEMPLTAPDLLADALHHAATTGPDGSGGTQVR